MPDHDPKTLFADLLDVASPPLPSREVLLTGARRRLRRRRITLAAGVAAVTAVALAGAAALASAPARTEGFAGVPSSAPSAPEADRPSASPPAAPAVEKSGYRRPRSSGQPVGPEQQRHADQMLAALVAALPSGYRPATDQRPRTTSVEGYRAEGWLYSVQLEVSNGGPKTLLRVSAFSDFGTLPPGCTGTTALAGDNSTDQCQEYTAADHSRIGVITRDGKELHAAWGQGDIAIGISQQPAPEGPRETTVARIFTEQQLADLVVKPEFRP